MQLRRQIITATLAAGGIFTFLLCWIIYFIVPLESGISRYGLLMATTDRHVMVAQAVIAIVLALWLIGSVAARLVQKRVDKALVSMRARLEEHHTVQRRMEKQKAILEKFAARAIPMTASLLDQANQLSAQTLELADATRGNRLSAEYFNQLLAATDDLSEEIQRIGDDARASAASAALMQHDLQALQAQQPELQNSTGNIQRIGTAFSILAVNAGIEHARARGQSGLTLLLDDVRRLSAQAEQIAAQLSQHLAVLEETAQRSASASAPLSQELNAIAMGTETLAMMADDHWAALDALSREQSDAPVPSGLIASRHRLMDTAQEMAEQTSMLQHSIEGLVKSLHAYA